MAIRIEELWAVGVVDGVTFEEQDEAVDNFVRNFEQAARLRELPSTVVLYAFERRQTMRGGVLVGDSITLPSGLTMVVRIPGWILARSPRLLVDHDDLMAWFQKNANQYEISAAVRILP